MTHSNKRGERTTLEENVPWILRWYSSLGSLTRYLGFLPVPKEVKKQNWEKERGFIYRLAKLGKERPSFFLHGVCDSLPASTQEIMRQTGLRINRLNVRQPKGSSWKVTEPRLPPLSLSLASRGISLSLSLEFKYLLFPSLSAGTGDIVVWWNQLVCVSLSSSLFLGGSGRELENN